MFIKSVPGRTVVITDVRFKNEAEWIRSQDGIVINVERDSQTIITENTHSSENDIESDDYDLLIKNNGTIDEMCNEVMYRIQKQ